MERARSWKISCFKTIGNNSDSLLLLSEECNDQILFNSRCATHSHPCWPESPYKNLWKYLESFKTVPQFPNLPVRSTRHLKYQCFWSQKRKIISHFKQVLLWHQKVNSLSLAAFNSQQHFVLGLCQVILGCEIVRNDGWLSAFCYLFLSPQRFAAADCKANSSFLFFLHNIPNEQQ